MSNIPLIRTVDLKQHFPAHKGLFGRSTAVVRAVDGISLDIGRRQVVGLVGESGSGKSTFGRAIMALDAPTSGSILFDGTDLVGLSRSALKPWRKRMQMVFQDPFSSLNPRMSIAETLGMPLRFHVPNMGRDERRSQSGDMLERVGLPRAYLDRFAHEFSGGQRQRIGVARALMTRPDFIMADEVVSALDVSVQAQVLNLFARLRREMDLTMLFITHDLAVVGHVSDVVAVMYLGRIVEIAPTRTLFTALAHPYTEALLSAAPSPDPGRARRRVFLTGDMPSPVNPPSGCPFRTRCHYALPACAGDRPELREITPSHLSACIRDDLNLTPATDDDRRAMESV